MNDRLIAFLIFGAYSVAEAGTLTTIHSFGTSPSDGITPNAGVVIGPGEVLYGTTVEGGSGACDGGCGTVFSLTPPASLGGPWTESVYSFPFPKAGGTPNGAVAIGGGGEIYGTTLYGGNCGGQGTVFELTPPASAGTSWVERVLVNFCGGGLNSAPEVGAGGELYVTSGGEWWIGTELRLTPPLGEPSGSPWTEAVLYDFGAGQGTPWASPVIGSHGVLYGTTFGGGVDNSNCGTVGCGTVYSLAPPATPGGSWNETTLYSFTSSGGDGGNPAAGVVIGPNGVLYGATLYGGNEGCGLYGCGTVFSLSPPASPGGDWTETVLYRFTGGGSDGADPVSLAIGSHGVLYGTTESGGNGSCVGPSSGCGTVFSLDPPASSGGVWTETILYKFSGEADGGYPLNVAIGPSGVLYGTTKLGGISNVGTVFSLVP